MPRARFNNLPADQQSRILSVALEEFAAHGYSGASLNRIISAAGISKGSMYYYFDDKADLYLHVVKVQMNCLTGDPVQLTASQAKSPEAFWSALEADCIRILGALSAAPMLAALLRDALTGTGATVIRQAQQELEGATLPWIEHAITSGQQVGAVRTDLPTGLLVAVAGAMGRAIDTWFLTQQLDVSQHPDLVASLVNLLRRGLKP